MPTFNFELPDGQIQPIEADTVEAAQKGLRNIIAANNNAAQAQEFVNTRIDTSPTENPRAFLAPQTFASESARQRDPQTLATTAAQSGVDVSTGLGPALRGKAGLLAFNPQTNAFVLDELVRNQLGGEVPDGVPTIKRDEVTGGVSFLRPQEDGSFRYTLIDPAGGELGDIAEFAGELPQLGLEVLGGIGGALAGGATGSPAAAFTGGIAGAGAGAALGLEARVAIAKALGIPEELIDDAVTSDVRLREVGLSVAGDVATAVGMGTGRMLRNAFRRPLNVEDLPQLERQIAENMKTVTRFEEGTGVEAPLSLAQLTGDEGLAIAEQNIANRARGATAEAIATRGSKADVAARKALQEISSQRTRTPPDAARSVEEVTQDVTTNVRQGRREAQQRLESTQEQVDSFGAELNDINDPAAFIKVRDDAFGAADRARQDATKAWDLYRKEVEWQQGQGSNVQVVSGADSPIKRALLEMDDNSQRALLESSRRSQQAFVKDAGLPEAGPTQGLAAEFLDPRELHFTLSDLKRRLRHADKGVDPDGFRAEDLRRMIGAIEETIETAPMARASSGRQVRPEKAARIREAWAAANDTTAANHSLFDSANMRELLQTKTRRVDGENVRSLDMPAGVIEKRMFAPGDARFLSDSLDAIDNNPAAKAALSGEMEKKYRRSVFDEAGNFRLGSHKQFMDDHADHMRVLGLDVDSIRDAATLARAVKVQKDSVDKMTKELGALFGGRLGADDVTDPINIAKEINDNLSTNKTKNLMRRLDTLDSTLADEVRDHSLAQVQRDIQSAGGKEISFDKVNRLVEERGASLGAVHGPQYLADLKSIRDLQALVENKRLAKSTTQEVQPGWMQVGRSVFGPLSKKQRFITAVNRQSRRMSGNLIGDIMSDPTQLRKFARLKGRSPKSVAFHLTLADLGLTPFVSEDLREQGRQASANLQGLPASVQQELRDRL